MKYKPLIILLVIAAAIALGNFTSNPGFWFDEGIIAGVSKSLVEDGIYGTKIAPDNFETQNFWITTNYPVTLPLAVVLKIFGIGVWQARLVPFVYLILFIAVVYLLIKRLYGDSSAFWSTLLLITFAPLYGNGKAVLGEVPGLFWYIFSLFLFANFADTKKIYILFFSVLSAGLAITTKPFYALLIPGLAFLFIKSVKNKYIHGKEVALTIFALCVPFVLWLVLTIGWTGISNLTETISYFTNSYAADSFIPTVRTNIWRFFSESTPLHFLFLSSIIILAAWRSRRAGTLTADIAKAILLFGLLAWLWYLKTPGWYRYFFSIHLLAIVFFVPALRFLFGRLSKVILLLLFLVQASHLLLNYNTFSSRHAINAANFLNINVPAEASILVVSHPEVTYLLKHKNVSQFIYINKRLSIGTDYIVNKNLDYIITADSETDFLNKNAEILESSYYNENIFGHYIFFKKK